MRKSILFIALALFAAGSLMAQTDTETTSSKKESKKTENTEKEKKEKGKFGAFLGRLGEATTGINMTDEPFIVNPLSSQIDVQLVGAYGNPTNGEVTLVIKVKMKTHDKYAGFGGYNGLMAYDKNGKTYKGGASTDKEIQTPKDLWVELKLDGYHIIQKVPETLAAFELINLKAHVARTNRATIELRNIPILWGVSPE